MVNKIIGETHGIQDQLKGDIPLEYRRLGYLRSRTYLHGVVAFRDSLNVHVCEDKLEPCGCMCRTIDDIPLSICLKCFLEVSGDTCVTNCKVLSSCNVKRQRESGISQKQGRSIAMPLTWGASLEQWWGQYQSRFISMHLSMVVKT